MATQPIFPATPRVSWSSVVTANTATDGTGTVSTAFTAGTNGSRIDKIVIRPLGTNATASVVRVFVNNGLTNATALNNALTYEATLPVNTIVQTAASNEIILDVTRGSSTEPVVLYLPGGATPYKINVSVGTAGTAGWMVVVYGGDY